MLQDHERLTTTMILLLTAKDRPLKEVEWWDCSETSSKLQTRRRQSGGKRKQHRKRFQGRLILNPALISGIDGTRNVVSEKALEKVAF
jgi:hypothetical protein